MGYEVVNSMKDVDNISWFKINVKLKSHRKIHTKSQPTFLTIEPIIKTINSITFGNTWQTLVTKRVLYHIKDKSFQFLARPDEIINLEIIFIGLTNSEIEYWLENFNRYFTQDFLNTNYELTGFSELQIRNIKIILNEFQNNLINSPEICLKFLIPVPFEPEPEKDRTFISQENFIKLFTNRLKRLFNIEFNFVNDTTFNVLPYYWNYTEIKHKSRTQEGTIQFIKGCVGPIYIKGNYEEFLPILLICSELHTGSKLSNSQGYYTISYELEPFFDKKLNNKKLLISVVDEVLDKYANEFETPLAYKKLVNEKLEFVDTLLKDLNNSNYSPEPSRAFVLTNESGKERIIETFHIKDLIVSQFILRIIEKNIDRIFERSSIGYRKGISREAIGNFLKRIKEKGYKYYLRTDIKDFFPSISHDKLNELIDFYLPIGDTKTKSIINKLIKSPFLVNNKVLTRENGIPQGLPLSPILSNLYLDSLDEFMMKFDVEYLRYADDILIFTKTKDIAVNLIRELKNYVKSLHLDIKDEKTLIDDIDKGLEFIGISFYDDELVIKPEKELKRYKKPLYITLPYTFLSLYGDAVNIIKDKQIIETIPLNRLSEIIIMEKSSLSSALIRKCASENIPITLTLGSGYYITTIKPDTKNFFLVNYYHTMKYFLLNREEILALAKEIVLIKINNYITLLNLKYQTGFNELISELKRIRENLFEVSDLNTLRGYEGIASKKMYKYLNYLIKNSQFHIKKRDRFNPDRINSLLNLGYYLLYGRINATLRSLGLNPYLGFLHSPYDNYEALAADIQEIFRASIDKFIIRLINLSIIKLDDFIESERGFYLKYESKQKFINEFEKELTKASKGNLSIGQSIYLQCEIIKEWAVEDKSIKFVNNENKNYEI
ncbi:MAG: CRISPR-associated endonuclease Cas1 [Candidatus Aenigmatarchaeota archaeon]